MTLSHHINTTLEHLLLDKGKSITNQQLISCIDLTLLTENASNEDLDTLKHQAMMHHVAAICVYPHHLPKYTSFSSIEPLRATVINFPDGHEAIALSLANTELAIESGANEIDYVLPYQKYLSDNQQSALNDCEQIATLCHAHGVKLKVILETGAFSDMECLYQLGKELIDKGADFLKTSTGKIPQGASLSAAIALLSAIKDTGNFCGFKCSGGIKNSIQARSYAFLAELLLEKNINNQWFRIGASSLLDELGPCLKLSR